MVILFGPCPLNDQAMLSSHIHMHTSHHKQVGVNLVFSHFLMMGK